MGACRRTSTRARWGARRGDCRREGHGNEPRGTGRVRASHFRLRRTSTFPGVKGHEPDLEAAHCAAGTLAKSMDKLLKVVDDPGLYVSESDFFDPQSAIVLGVELSQAGRGEEEI